MKKDRLSRDRYLAYKDSEVEWIGEVPEHWNIYHLKNIVSVKITDGPHETPIFTDDGVPFISAEAIQNGGINFDSKRGYISKETDKIYAQKCKPKRDDIFIIKSGSTTGKIGYVSTDINFSIWSPLALVRANKTNYSRYLFYFLSSSPFQSQVQMYWSFGTQPNIGMKVLENLQIFTPSFSEQEAIADYLDTKTAQIDRKIDLLTQKAAQYANLKQSLINETVTRGFDRAALMKNSEGEWFDCVPSDWNEKRVKDLFRLVTDVAPDNNNYELLSVYASIGVRPRKDLEQRGNKASTTDGYWIVKKGDIVVNKLLAWMGSIGLSNYEGVTSPAYDVLRKLNNDIEERFYGYLFRTGKAQEIFKKSSRGIMDMRLRLYFDKLGAITVPVPPIAEQIAIADYLDTKTAQIDRVIQTINTQIEKLQELRKTLINDVVTGKIKVV